MLLLLIEPPSVFCLFLKLSTDLGLGLGLDEIKGEFDKTRALFGDSICIFFINCYFFLHELTFLFLFLYFILYLLFSHVKNCHKMKK